MKKVVNNRVVMVGPDFDAAAKSLGEAVKGVEVDFDVRPADMDLTEARFVTDDILVDAIDHLFWDVMANRWAVSVCWDAKCEGTPKTVTYRLDMLEWHKANQRLEVQRCAI